MNIGLFSLLAFEDITFLASFVSKVVEYCPLTEKSTLLFLLGKSYLCYCICVKLPEIIKGS